MLPSEQTVLATPVLVLAPVLLKQQARRTLRTAFNARAAYDGFVSLLKESIDVVERLGADAATLACRIVERKSVRRLVT